MKYLLIAFRSRNDAYLVKNLLSLHMINGELINTPIEISKSCGISLKYNFAVKNKLMSTIKSTQLPIGYIGTYLVVDEYGERIINKI